MDRFANFVTSNNFFNIQRNDFDNASGRYARYGCVVFNNRSERDLVSRCAIFPCIFNSCLQSWALVFGRGLKVVFYRESRKCPALKPVLKTF